MKTPSIEGGVSVWVAFAAALAIVGAAVVSVQASASNASIALKKDSNGLFLLTVSDPDGIKSFSLVPAGRGPYGGEIAKCPRTFQNTNVLFTDPADFTPVMDASVTDCQGNTDELKIPPPQAGATKSKRLQPPAPPPAVTPEPTPPAAGEGVARPSARPARSEAETEAAKAKIIYPVAELGNCGSEAACRAYCEELPNVKACVAYAEAHGLITAEEAVEGRRFADIGGRGPGGCTSRDSCAAYCEDVSRIEECLDFAEKNGFLSGKELEEVRAVARVRREGVAFPGGCTTKAACEVYCGEASHIDECLAFAERSGLIPPEELAMAKKMLPLIKEGKTPGGCTRKETCEAYCQQPANMRQCLAFAEEQGLIPAEELAMAKKFLPLMEKGETPGGCRSKETCEAYCGEAGHMEECIAFGEKAGFIKPEEAAAARRGGGKGPGDCKGREECEAFCQQPENLETCQAFGREHGIEVGGGPGGCTSQEECMAYCQANPDECQKFAPPGVGGPGGGFPGGPGGGFPGGGIPSGESYVGPGGCRTPDECIRYCKEPGHEKECNEFKTPSTTPYAKGRGPGGCGSVEECREYCNAHQAECDAFVSEDVPPEGKCQAGYQIERDALGYKYCNPLSCPENQEFVTDVFGRRACSPTGIPSGSGGLPSVPPGGSPADGGMPGAGFPQVPPGGFPAVPGFTPPQVPGAAPSTEGSAPSYEYKVDCSLFAQAPKCEYVGSPGSQNYNYCKQCYPDRAAPSPVTPPSSSEAPAASPLGLIIAPFVELFR